MRTLVGSLVVVSLALSSAAAGFEVKKDATGAPVRWLTPLHFTVSRDFEGALKASGALAALTASAQTYSGRDGVPGVDVGLGETTGVGFDFTGAHNLNEVVVLTDWPFNPKALASTVVTVDKRSHSILDADVAFNHEANDFKVLPADSVRGGHFDDVQNTFTHELGHALGLAHEEQVLLAVMYPEAFSGDVNKRQLSSDDEAGLTSLYGGTVNAPADQPSAADGSPQAGCSASGQAAWPACVLLVLLAVARSRRASFKRPLAAVLALALLAPSAFATPNPLPISLEAVAKVTASRTVVPLSGRGLLMTELTLSLVRCVSGACTSTVTVQVPGGQFGDLEQFVDGQSVPVVGDEVLVTQYLLNGHTRWAVQGRAPTAPGGDGTALTAR